METRKVSLKIRTYGKAPAKYGTGAYKVGLVERVLLVKSGWKHAGSGRGYEYVVSPTGKAGASVSIEVDVPTDAEILRMALELHAGRKRMVTQVPGFIVEYCPSGEILYTFRETGAIYSDASVDPPGEEQIVRSKAAEYKIGVESPWSVSLIWDKGDDAEPTWYRHGAAAGG